MVTFCNRGKKPLLLNKPMHGRNFEEIGYYHMPLWYDDFLSFRQVPNSPVLRVTKKDVLSSKQHRDSFKYRRLRNQ